MQDKEFNYNSLFNYDKTYSQKECNNCWAYSILSMIEMIHRIKTKETLELSVAHFTLCSFPNPNEDSCRTSSMINAINSIKKLNIFQKEKISNLSNLFIYDTGSDIRKNSSSSYKETVCNSGDLATYKLLKEIKFKYSDYIINNKENHLNTFYDLISQGPMVFSVFIQKKKDTCGLFETQHYRGGYLKYKDCNNLDEKSTNTFGHAIVVSYYKKVGDEITLGGVNSWGKWGVQGKGIYYFKVNINDQLWWQNSFTQIDLNQQVQPPAVYQYDYIDNELNKMKLNDSNFKI